MDKLTTQTQQQDIALADPIGSAIALTDQLATADDDQLDLLRTQAHQMSAAAWLIGCANDAEFVRRCDNRPNRPDIGKTQALRLRARSLGLHERRLQKNAAIYRMFFQQDGPATYSRAKLLALVAEPVAYDNAMLADDPQQALFEFAREREENPGALVKRARAIAESSKAPALDELIPQPLSSDDTEKALQTYLAAARALVKAAPLAGRVLNEDHEEELRFALELPSQTYQERILAIVDEANGCDLDTVAGGLALPREQTQALLSRMVEQRRLTTRPAERHTGARGAVRMLYEVK